MLQMQQTDSNVDVGSDPSYQFDKYCIRYYYYRKSNTMRVTEKGQVTIPLPIREALGIKQATEVDFILEGDHAILRRSANTELVAERLARYKGVATTNMSTEQILALTRS